MKALVQDIYGPSAVLRLDEVARPEPAAGQVLVRVAAASVNAADWHIMRGEPRIARLMDRHTFGRTGPRQRIRGRDFAGTIEDLGPVITGWQNRSSTSPTVSASERSNRCCGRRS